MRRGGRALLGLLVLMSGPVAVVMAASPASGGIERTLTVTKVVEGSAPPGAQFVVDVECEDETVTPTQMTFTGAGSQTATVFDSNVTCTVVESGTAGASSVTYTCEVPSDQAQALQAPSECVSDNSVHFEATPNEATITITNTFPPAPPEPAQPPAAEPITAAARFTG